MVIPITQIQNSDAVVDLSSNSFNEREWFLPDPKLLRNAEVELMQLPSLGSKFRMHVEDNCQAIPSEPNQERVDVHC